MIYPKFHSKPCYYIIILVPEFQSWVIMASRRSTGNIWPRANNCSSQQVQVVSDKIEANERGSRGNCRPGKIASSGITNRLTTQRSDCIHHSRHFVGGIFIRADTVVLESRKRRGKQIYFVIMWIRLISGLVVDNDYIHGCTLCVIGYHSFWLP